MSRFRWGIFGTGAISAKFVAGLARLNDAEVTMVASRESTSAAGFARTFAIPHAIRGYSEAAAAGLVDAIYIATPPALHRAHALAAIAAGVPVLIEKPFAATPGEAAEIVAAAQSSGVFCMEGMWTRFLPAALRLRALVRDGAVGEPRQVTGGFGISNAVDPAFGNFDAGRGGGALAHLGVYPVSLGQWLFGEPQSMAATGRVGETGVEEEAAVTLRYGSGVVGAFETSLRAPIDHFAVHGTHGSVRLLGPIYRPWGIAIERSTPRRAAGGTTVDPRRESHLRQRVAQFRAAFGRGGGTTERHFFAGNGYQYEAAEVAACVRRGAAASDIMPLADSVAVTRTLDRLRTAIIGAEA